MTNATNQRTRTRRNATANQKSTGSSLTRVFRKYSINASSECGIGLGVYLPVPLEHLSDVGLAGRLDQNVVDFALDDQRGNPCRLSAVEVLGRPDHTGHYLHKFDIRPWLFARTNLQPQWVRSF